jgi:AcrR family transcriptional regulator
MEKMALERFLRLPLEQRTSLLEIAATVFAEEGYEGTSYNELLQKVGMGKSQAYYYFADKADFFITAIAAVYEDFYSKCAELPEPACAEEFWQQMEQLHLMGFRYQVENPIAAQLSLAALRSPVRFQLADALMNQQGTSRSQYQYWIRLGQRLGAVRDDLPENLLVEMSLNQSLFVDEWFAAHHAQACLSEMKQLAADFTGISQRMLKP